ncbi:MAG TPA: MBL fold metallo-hydrolase [Methylophilaceae bacterium]|nr:MBL fold metallo-hydrolase [Methylophilaceae bacterium]
MRFASLGSGSAGNATIVNVGTTTLLLDCGFGLKDVLARLQRFNVAPEQLTGILVTHEHDDHAKGVFRLAAKYAIPVWLTHGTQRMCERYMPESASIRMNIIDNHTSFSIQDLDVTPYPVPHDAREPTQFVFSDGAKRLGVLTDTGCSTPYIEQVLSACDALLLECNHDLTMLEKGPYARPLKDRVGGRLGHLDNQSAANLLSRLDNSKLKHLIAAHLSAKNNTPALAKSALSAVMGCEQDWIGVADQSIGLEWRSL